MGVELNLDRVNPTKRSGSRAGSAVEDLISQNTQRRRMVSSVLGKAATLFQGLADYLTVLGSYMLAYWIYLVVYVNVPQTPFEFFTISLGVAALYIFIIDRVGLYRREMSLLNVKELRGIFHVGLVAAAMVLSLSFYVRSTSFSRLTLTFAIVTTPVWLYLQRQIFHYVHLLFHKRGWSQKRVLIYGAGDIGRQLAKRMFESPSLGYLPIGFLDDEKKLEGRNVRWRQGPRGGVPVLGGEELVEKYKDIGADFMFIALPSAKFERNQNLVKLCIEKGLDYAIVPNAYEKFIQRIELFEIGGIPILRRRTAKTSLVFLFLKRIIDFTVSTILIALLSPLLLLFGIAIRLESKGPIIFKQKRTGLRGKEFSFYKFRSMYIDADKYAVTPKIQTDPRITKIGRWLRRTSLDELPQLFNVWRGDMSLVGPRPEMPFIVKNYTPLERERLSAKPGITGVWQISAVRGEPIHANLEYDLFYLENRSISLDMAILIKTFLSVLRGIGAR